MAEPGLLKLDWALPPGVMAWHTTRAGGHSRGPWAGFNLGGHVDDDPAAVAANRAGLLAALRADSGDGALEVQWLRQVHGSDVCRTGPVLHEPPRADAVITAATGTVCGILTADCLPVLLCDNSGREVAAAHAGWRGLCQGVLENTVAAFACAPGDLRAWLGPAIGPCHFEVGMDVRDQFLGASPAAFREATATAFKPGAHPDKFLADLYQLATARLRHAGVTAISGGVDCTVCAPDTWYSYRRDGTTGRHAALITLIR